MIKVIKNGIVITMDLKREKIENIDIIIKDYKIIDIVNNYSGPYDEIIDATDKVVLPGLINAHTHLGMSLFRATNDNLNLNDWLTKKIWPLEDKLTDEDVYYSTLVSLIEMIKTGTTLSNDMYFNCIGSIKAIKETFSRVMFTRCLTGNDSLGDKRIEEFLKLYEENKDNELIKFTVAPHALYTCDPTYLKKCSELSLKLNLPIHLHYSENEDEIKGVFRDYNKSPFEILKETGLLNNKLILAHATFIPDNDLEEFKKHDVNFVHNPISNLNLGCGIADINKYRNYVNVCLGTDGQGSGNNLNMFYHMSMTDMLQKGLYKDPTIFSSYEVLKMATINGAKALGMSDLVGSIEIGKKADIIILDMSNIEIYPTVDLITNLVHNTESNNVDTTIVNGKVLMQNHQLKLNIDEITLKEKIKEIINRIK